jgi:hypothetical protein
MIPDYKIFWSVDDDAYIATTTEFKGFSGIDKNPIAALAILMDAVYMGRQIIKEDDKGEPCEGRR